MTTARPGAGDDARPAVGAGTRRPMETTPMDRALYHKWNSHPLRYLLKRAQQGDHIYPDELDDLRLPSRVRSATRAAIKRAPELNPLEVDRLSAELVEALPPEHETREQHEQRRAEQGDAEALANRRAQDEARAEMADRIMRGA